MRPTAGAKRPPLKHGRVRPPTTPADASPPQLDDLAALRKAREARHGVPKPPPSSLLTQVLLPLAAVPAKYFLLAAAVSFSAWRLAGSDPLAGGAVPAAKRPPDQHWTHLKSNPNIVRELTANAGRGWFRRMLKTRTVREEIENADYGGENGHEAEEPDDGVGYSGRFGARDQRMFMETLRVTRCVTTQSALVAYFCGAAIQHDQDHDAVNPKGFYGGYGRDAVSQFNSTLSAFHARGEAAGNHERRVYRLGVGSEDGQAGYAHVWTIVTLESGHFYWLQSFIGHYSLISWMSTVEKQVGSSARAAAGMDLATLQGKLALLQTLFDFDSWTEQTNDAYLALFHVDMIQARSKRDGLTKHERVAHQRLGSLSWDVACTFPTPDEPEVGNADGAFLKEMRAAMRSMGMHVGEQPTKEQAEAIMKKMIADAAALHELDEGEEGGASAEEE